MRLVVDPVVASISGRVVDGEGAPVVDARVAVSGGDRRSVTGQGPAAVTDLDGTFRIDDLPLGDHELVVQTSDRSSRVRRTIAAGTSGVTLVAARAICDAPAVHDEPEGLTRPNGKLVWDHQIALVGWKVRATVRRGVPLRSRWSTGRSRRSTARGGCSCTSMVRGCATTPTTIRRAAGARPRPGAPAS